MTRMVLFLCQSDQIIRGRAGPTCEPDFEFTPAKDRHFKGPGETRRSFWAVPATSLPLSPASPAHGFTTTRTRAQSSLHGEAAPRCHWEGSTASSAKALFHQFVGGAGAALGAGSSQRPWLNLNASQGCVVKLTSYQIVMCHKSCPRFTARWCPKTMPKAGIWPWD